MENVEQEVKEETEITCPRCGKGKMWLTKTKRSFAWKCNNQECLFDTNAPTDWSSHRRRELEALPFLKKIAPDLNFTENIGYGFDYLLEAEDEADQHMVYDAKSSFGGFKLDRFKISYCANINVERYLTSDEQYLQGRQTTFSKLAGMNAILVWYFPNDSGRIAIGMCKDIAKVAVEVRDRFNNFQYSIPREARAGVIFTDPERINEILHRNIYKKMTERRYVL